MQKLTIALALIISALTMGANNAQARSHHRGWHRSHHKVSRIYHLMHNRERVSFAVREIHAEPNVAGINAYESPYSEHESNLRHQDDTFGDVVQAGYGGNRDIVEFARRYVGSRNPLHLHVPGCKAFVNYVAQKTHYYADPSLLAARTPRMGRRIMRPVPGSYRVAPRRGGSHVDIVAEVLNGEVVTINGNKGNNRVGYSHKSIRGAQYYMPIRVAAR